MKTAKLFQNGKSQAVRLPKEFRFSGEEVFIKKVGPMTILFSTDDPWGLLVDSLDQFSDDYLQERDQLPMQERDDLL